MGLRLIVRANAGHSGAFIVDPLNHYLGRRGEIFVTALCLTATPIGSGFARTWQELFAARFVMGIGIGAKNATVPIYSAEMAPARIRGALVMFWQLWVVAGMFKQYREPLKYSTNQKPHRYLPRFLRQCHRQGHRRYLLAPPARIRIYPLVRPRRWHLFLP